MLLLVVKVLLPGVCLWVGGKWGKQWAAQFYWWYNSLLCFVSVSHCCYQGYLTTVEWCHISASLIGGIMLCPGAIEVVIRSIWGGDCCTLNSSQQDGGRVYGVVMTG